MPYLTSTTFGGASGFSCCYRDHNDDESNLGLLHGAVLSFKIIFEADALGENGRVLATVDMGNIEEFLDVTFGHTTIVAQDDPSLEAFEQLNEDDAIDLVITPRSSLENFAKTVYDYCDHWLGKKSLQDRVTVHSVECREHDGSSAIYARDDTVIEFTEDKEVKPA
jgi:6-pyruvoyltetrahydropterin/6-carboxytetrahydropterin synthase